MSASDWEEIKRLAADFQRTQLTTNVQRLSEQNCIEIINKLVDTKLLEVVFTTDGKEYITPQHLLKEIKDELFVHHGRINLVELAKILTVDLGVISLRASDLEKSNSAIRIINGQLIHNTYTNFICEEISEKLKLKGRVTIAELSSQYDLPSDFLLSLITKQLGKTIKAQQDSNDHFAFFTESFKKRNISLIRGGLLGATKPIPVTTILNLCNIEEHLFQMAFNYLNDAKETSGTVSGREAVTGTYTPAIYTKSQSDWVKNFYAQNGYLEYSALSRIGIQNPLKFIEKNFQNINLYKLDSCVIGQFIYDQIEAVIEEAISTASFVNVLPILPVVAVKRDAEIILDQIMKRKKSQSLHVFNSSLAVTDQCLRNLMKSFDNIINEKAREYVSSGAYFQYLTSQGKNYQKTSVNDEKFDYKVDKKEERRKKATEGKGGGGTMGRETKTRSTKKKYGKVAQNESDSDNEKKKRSRDFDQKKLEIIQIDDIITILKKLELFDDDEDEEEKEVFFEEIANHLYPKLTKEALETAKTIHESTIAASNADKKKKHNELQEKLNNLVLRVRLFEKGYKQFNEKDTQQQLAKYLLKTICTDVSNEIFAYIAQDSGKFEGKEMTNELRQKIVNSVPHDQKQALNKLNKSLTSSSLDDFLNVIDEVVGPGFCDILLKKSDKKKERSQLMEQRQQLIDQINLATDSALVLHLATLIIFQEVTQTMLHASGRHVSTILSFLQPYLPDEKFDILQSYHDSVLKVLTSSVEDQKIEAQKFLDDQMPSVKEIAVAFRKSHEKPYD